MDTMNIFISTNEKERKENLNNVWQMVVNLIINK